MVNLGRVEEVRTKGISIRVASPKLVMEEARRIKTLTMWLIRVIVGHHEESPQIEADCSDQRMTCATSHVHLPLLSSEKGSAVHLELIQNVHFSDECNSWVHLFWLVQINKTDPLTRPMDCRFTCHQARWPEYFYTAEAPNSEIEYIMGRVEKQK